MSVEELALSLPKIEKIRLMEALWSDLSTPQEDYDSPEWHQHELNQTKEKFHSGAESAVDWDKAKQMLRAR